MTTMPAAQSTVLDVQERDFETAVVEKSRSVPVVVDFWAPWCGPCRVLGPILERLAVEMQGAFVLAKINVDENPGVSRRFGVRGIPMVLAFRDGDKVDEFTGALPESQVRSWLRKLIPSGADRLAAEAASMATTNPEAAAEKYRAALAEDPAHLQSLLGLGRLLVLAGDPEATETLKRVPAGSPGFSEAQSLLTLSSFLAPPASSVQAGEAAATGAGSAEARFESAAQHARAGRWEQALQELLEIIRLGGASPQNLADDARRMMLAIFVLLGEGDAVVPRYRRLLANALF